jgi:hypothetical protein
MINSNFIILLLGLVAAFAFGMDQKQKTIKENFNTFQLKARVVPYDGDTMTDLPANPVRTAAIVGRSVEGPVRLGGDLKGKFVTYPNYQSVVPPRFNPTGNTPYINARLPDRDHLAEPANPLGYPKSVNTISNNAMTYNKMVSKENYDSGDYSGGGSYGLPPPPNYHANQALYDEMKAQMPKTTFLEGIPVETMETVNPDGEIENVRVIDRLMYSNFKSRQYGQADFIRGDLPIVPCNRGWFTVSARPSIDLNPGAMAVMGGIGNETTKATWALQSKYSGGTGQTSNSIAGLGFDPAGRDSKMTLEKGLGMSPDEGVSVVTTYADASPRQGPIQVTAFP